MNYFYYNGKKSREMGIYITGQPYSSPERDIDVIEIPGRSGNLLIDNGRFRDLDVTYTCYMAYKLHEKSRAIKAWLLSDLKIRELQDTYDLNYFRYGYCSSAMNITQESNIYSEFDIVFHCKPHLYRRAGKTPVVLTSPGTLINPEQFESKPIIKLYASGDVTFSIGEQQVSVSAVDGYAVLDCDAMQIYKDGENLSANMAGDYPQLNAGKNEIAFTGASKIEITPRWRTI